MAVCLNVWLCCVVLKCAVRFVRMFVCLVWFGPVLICLGLFVCLCDCLFVCSVLRVRCVLLDCVWFRSLCVWLMCLVCVASLFVLPRVFDMCMCWSFGVYACTCLRLVVFGRLVCFVCLLMCA